jgi:hypothetical protein
MSGPDGSPDEMSVFRRQQPPSLDSAAAERMLAGLSVPGDSAPELDALARLLASASGPATAAELSSEAAAVAAFAQVTGDSVPAPTALQRKPMLASPLRSKLALAVAAGAASLGGFAAAAYANALPAPIQDAAHNVIGAGASQGHASPTASDETTEATPTEATPTEATPTATPVGPDATGSAMYGLCTAWAASSVHGNAMDAVAFRNLATAAGGADNIAAFCAAVTPPGAPTTHPGNTTHPTGPPTGAPSTGAPSDLPTHPTGAPSDHPTGPPATHPTGP